MGLLMRIGFSIIALMISTSDNVLFLYFSIQIGSFWRTNSIGLKLSFFRIRVNSLKVGGFSKYLIISNSFSEFSIKAKQFLDLPHLGL